MARKTPAVGRRRRGRSEAAVNVPSLLQIILLAQEHRLKRLKVGDIEVEPLTFAPAKPSVRPASFEKLYGKGGARKPADVAADLVDDEAESDDIRFWSAGLVDDPKPQKEA